MAKENILKIQKESKGSHTRKPIKLSADFSAENFLAVREWHDLFKILKRKNRKPRVLYPARLSFKIGEIKNFSDKQ